MSAYTRSRSSSPTLEALISSRVGDLYSFPFCPSTTTAVIVSPRRPARPSRRRSAIVKTEPQAGQVAPVRLIVPAPASVRSPPSSTSRRPLRTTVAKDTAPPSPNTSNVPSTRLFPPSQARFTPFRHSQRVLRSGTLVRQSLQVAVRAHRYATTGFTTQRGLASSSKYSESNSLLNSSTAAWTPTSTLSSICGGRCSHPRAVSCPNCLLDPATGSNSAYIGYRSATCDRTRSATRRAHARTCHASPTLEIAKGISTSGDPVQLVFVPLSRSVRSISASSFAPLNPLAFNNAARKSRSSKQGAGSDNFLSAARRG